MANRGHVLVTGFFTVTSPRLPLWSLPSICISNLTAMAMDLFPSRQMCLSGKFFSVTPARHTLHWLASLMGVALQFQRSKSCRKAVAQITIPGSCSLSPDHFCLCVLLPAPSFAVTSRLQALSLYKQRHSLAELLCMRHLRLRITPLRLHSGGRET